MCEASYLPIVGDGMGDGIGLGVGHGFAGSSGDGHGVGEAVGDGLGVGVCWGSMPSVLPITNEEPTAPVIKKAEQHTARIVCFMIYLPGFG